MRLRSVAFEDMPFLYRLHGDPNIRKKFHCKKYFTFTEHLEWWDDMMLDEEFEAKVIWHGKYRAGCIRRLRDVVSIAVTPRYQNKGLGSQALKKFTKKGDRAEIYLDNHNSMIIFQRAGFKPAYLGMSK